MSQSHVDENPKVWIKVRLKVCRRNTTLLLQEIIRSDIVIASDCLYDEANASAFVQMLKDRLCPAAPSIILAFKRRHQP